MAYQSYICQPVPNSVAPQNRDMFCGSCRRRADQIQHICPPPWTEDLSQSLESTQHCWTPTVLVIPCDFHDGRGWNRRPEPITTSLSGLNYIFETFLTRIAARLTVNCVECRSPKVEESETRDSAGSTRRSEQ
ncbi:Hypothetical predicted protein, partial [Pelobates cultripes]